MAMYFDRHINSSDNNGTPLLLAWHSSQPVLAVGSINPATGGSVDLYQQHGERVESCKVERVCSPAVISWHPNKLLLCVGWETGEVVLLMYPSGESTPLPQSTHSTCISQLVWSHCGGKLVTGDQGGVVALWKVDARGRFLSSHVVKQEFGNPVTCCIYRPSAPIEDMALLARAAVSGDENALDKFNWKNSGRAQQRQDILQIFCSTADGSVFRFDEHGRWSRLLSVEGAVQKLVYVERKSVLAVVTDSLMLSQFSLVPDGGAHELSKVKLCVKSGQMVDILWTENAFLITAAGEPLVRLWDLERDDNYVLALDENLGFAKGELLTCVSFCSPKAVIAAGSNKGRVAMWRMVTGPTSKGESSTNWKLQPPTEVEGNVNQLQWGSNLCLLAVCTGSSVHILSEQLMCSHYSQQVAAVQLTPNNVSLTYFSGNIHLILYSETHVQALQVAKDSVTVWDGKYVTVYKPTGPSFCNTGTFWCENPALAIYDDNIYTVEPYRVQVRTPQGTVKQLLKFAEAEGNPMLLSVCKSYLAVGTDTACVRVFDLTRREAKPLCNAKSLKEEIPNLGSLQSVKCNASGSIVSLLVTQVDGRPDYKVYFYDVEMDTVTHFDFSMGRTPSGFLQFEDVERNQVGEVDLSGRCPISHFWDETEPRLFVCEAAPLNADSQEAQSETAEVLIVTFFVTQEHGLLLQDSAPKPPGVQALLALDAPYYFYTCELGCGEPSPSPQMVVRRALRDFIGLENCDKVTRDALLNFSFYLTISDMDEAFKAIKLIKSEAVWESMARMCVKSRRLDVARVCLGNMGNARAARALREAQKEPELEAQVAMLATQLGMLEEAERLYRSCGRFDLLNKFYQACGKWQQAIETAETYDRVHLRTTYYSYAKHLEAMGDNITALSFYEKSDTHRTEVPRMLVDDTVSLESYVNKMRDRTLFKWWAQYLESLSDMESALRYYEQAQDYLSLVRVHCYLGDSQKASEIANETGNRAASYHLARQYEAHEDIGQSVHFYTRAQAYNNAIRLCKENNLDEQLLNLALLSNPEDMMEAACYYEEKNVHMDRAVMLYHKAGHVSKALELAFATEQLGALEVIAEDLDENSDPVLLARCSDFFINHAQYQKAVELLVAAKKYHEALQVCLDQNLTVTEDLAERMTVMQGSIHLSEDQRKDMLEQIANCCMRQGNYHLATKKYTQAGNKVKAMRALLKSGDTEKIVFFAGVSRQKDIYIMAANYLQSLDWRKDPKIFKNVIDFYTKGRALDLLAGFYEACAQMEIDDYGNYEKALGAMLEASKCLSKVKDKCLDDHDHKVSDLTRRISLMKRFIQARRAYEEDPSASLKVCEALLQEPNPNSAVRVGHVYGFMVEHYCQQGNYQLAVSKLKELKQTLPSINLGLYISHQNLADLQNATGLQLTKEDFDSHVCPNTQDTHLDNEEEDEVIEENDSLSD